MAQQRLPIIGLALDESPSEAVQRAAFDAAGIEVEIERWERRPHQLADAIAALRKDKGAIGAMIHSPHKEKVPALLDALSDDARTSGAANVVVRDGTKLRGHNTDADGIRAGLLSVLPKVKGKWPRQAVVLGAGGGARAAVAVLIQSGFQHVSVFNRHLHKAEALVSHFGRSARHMELRARPWHEAILESELAKSPLLIHATAESDPNTSPVPDEILPEGLAVLDLSLNAAPTALMRAAKARGGSVANGQASFLAASGIAFRLWTKQEPATGVMKSALEAALGAPAAEDTVVGD
jgi:shikimate dehydrogenase